MLFVEAGRGSGHCPLEYCRDRSEMSVAIERVHGCCYNLQPQQDGPRGFCVVVLSKLPILRLGGE